MTETLRVTLNTNWTELADGSENVVVQHLNLAPPEPEIEVYVGNAEPSNSNVGHILNDAVPIFSATSLAGTDKVFARALFGTVVIAVTK